LGKGTEVNLQLKSGTLVISRARGKCFRLSALLAQARKTNVHSETEWGGPMGRELW
jgi:antitoxin component of MazEF toxin-antitoxin module